MKWLSHVWLFATPWTVAYQVSLSMEFSRQEYWSGLPFPSPGDLPDPGIEPRSPALQTDTLTSELPGKPFYMHYKWCLPSSRMLSTFNILSQSNPKWHNNPYLVSRGCSRSLEKLTELFQPKLQVRSETRIYSKEFYCKTESEILFCYAMLQLFLLT